MRYEALFYNGWIEPPAYYLLGDAEGDSINEALANNLERLTGEARRLFGLNSTDVDAERIQESLYLLQPDSLVCARNALNS